MWKQKQNARPRLHGWKIMPLPPTNLSSITAHDKLNSRTGRKYHLNCPFTDVLVGEKPIQVELHLHTWKGYDVNSDNLNLYQQRRFVDRLKINFEVKDQRSVERMQEQELFKKSKCKLPVVKVEWYRLLFQHIQVWKPGPHLAMFHKYHCTEDSVPRGISYHVIDLITIK